MVLVCQDAGMDIPGLLGEMEKLPREMFSIRQKLSPLRSELAMLKARYDSKGRSPSHFDIQRSLLLSELKEEARVTYYRNPDYREDSKGRKVRIELTDGRAEDVAHAHPRYRKFIEESQDELKRMAQISREMQPLFDRIEGLKGREKYLTLKLEQGRALTYTYNASMSKL
jgi:predicted  nucleic acid-binding Zn-ribbon protein